MNDGEEAGTDTGDGQRSLRDDGQEGRPGEGQVLDGQATERYSEKGGDETVGEVYFVQTEDQKYVKVGWSMNVPKRVRELRTACPGLKLLGVISGGLDTEAEIHRQLIEDRYEGEWFRNSPAVQSFISTLSLREQPRHFYSMRGRAPLNPKCLRCGYEWIRRKPGWPKCCPGCKQPAWNHKSVGRAIYSSAIARKAGLAGGRGRKKG